MKQTATNLVSSIMSTSWGAVIGVLEWPAVGSSLASSPLVDDTTCVQRYTALLQINMKINMRVSTLKDSTDLSRRIYYIFQYCWTWKLGKYLFLYYLLGFQKRENYAGVVTSQKNQFIQKSTFAHKLHKDSSKILQGGENLT